MESVEIDKNQKIIELLEERRLAHDIIEVDEKRIQVVLFYLAGDLYGFYGSSVKMILPLDVIFPVPGTPPYLLGLTNVRGDIEAVIDLKVILNLPPAAPDPKNRLILTHSQGVVCGVLVDRVEEVMAIPVSQIVEVQESQSIHALVVGKTSYAQRDVILLDVARIFKNYLNFTE